VFSPPQVFPLSFESQQHPPECAIVWSLPSDDDHKNVHLLIRELTVAICTLLVKDQAAAF
jgi:hypothetical protein